MSWDNEYRHHKRVWGEGPSALASFAVDYLQELQLYQKTLSILDIGCGYGRDAVYLCQHTDCTIVGIDNSQGAIEMARGTRPKEYIGRIDFKFLDFTRLPVNDRYDVVFASNLYQLLRPEERAAFRKISRRVLSPNGLLFLSTLSTSDPEHYGKGTAAVGDINSFVDEKYLHLCTCGELEREFSFLNIKELKEHEYYEPRATGRTHHHISWLLVGHKE